MAGKTPILILIMGTNESWMKRDEGFFAGAEVPFNSGWEPSAGGRIPQAIVVEIICAP
ncbi:MAG: hypothetical protein JST36_06115 [Bacteroidetes bacterium]|nr:hypothetical protein [Bacteroidota bacterium]